jgi:hypothetical protein
MWITLLILCPNLLKTYKLPPSLLPTTKYPSGNTNCQKIKCYMVASSPSPKSLHLKVELQTTDTREVLATNALLDCGATGLFIDMEYVKQKWLTVQNLARPIPVYNVDGALNEAGAISGTLM